MDAVYHVSLTKDALTDIEGILAWHDDALRGEVGRTLVARIFERIDTLQALTERGRMVPEVDSSQIREIFESSYRIIYRVKEAEAVILAVYHSSREFSFEYLGTKLEER
jgi:plasmid stabilization system protein ParE